MKGERRRRRSHGGRRALQRQRRVIVGGRRHVCTRAHRRGRRGAVGVFEHGGGPLRLEPLFKQLLIFADAQPLLCRRGLIRIRLKGIILYILCPDLGREPVRAKRRLAAVIDEVEDALFVCEAHLDLRGVHVHVDRLGRDREVQHAGGVSPHHQRVAVALLERGHAGFRAHEAGVDEEILKPARAAREGGPADYPVEREAVRLIADGDRVFGKLPAEHAPHRREHLPVPRRLQAHDAVAQELDGHSGIAERRLFDGGGDAVALRDVLF